MASRALNAMTPSLRNDAPVMVTLVMAAVEVTNQEPSMSTDPVMDVRILFTIE